MKWILWTGNNFLLRAAADDYQRRTHGTCGCILQNTVDRDPFLAGTSRQNLSRSSRSFVASSWEKTTWPTKATTTGSCRYFLPVCVLL